MKAMIAAAILLVSASTVLAGPTKKSFAHSCDAVWTAEQNAVNFGGYKNVVIDQGHRTISFADNSVVTISTSLSGSGDTCTVEATEIAPPLSGHKNSLNFFKRVDNALASSK